MLYFVEVKSIFLTYEDFCQVIEKYLSAKEILGGIIVAFYGYSKEILKVVNKYDVLVLDGKDIKNYFMYINKLDTAKLVEDFLNLNYNKWKMTLPTENHRYKQKDAKYKKQMGIEESKIFKEF